MNPQFLTDADVYRRVGGADKLAQLIDPERTGQWNQDTLDAAKQDACNQVLAAAGVQSEHVTDVTDFRDKFPHLVTIAAQKAVILAWTYGTSGMAIPDALRELSTELSAAMEDLSRNRRAHGSVTYSPTASRSMNGAVSVSANTLTSWQRSPFC